MLGGVSGILDAADDAIPGAASTAAQHLDGDEGGLLGQAILDTSDGTGDVSAVTVAVRVDGISEVVAPDGTTVLELLVGGKHTSVDDVDVNVLASPAVEVVVITFVDVTVVDSVQILSSVEVSRKPVVRLFRIRR